MRRRIPCSALLLVAWGCSGLDSSFLADRARDAGAEPAEVRVTFSGNRNIGTSALLSTVQSSMIALSRGQSPESAAYDGADAIADRYRFGGFPDARATWTVEGPVPSPTLPDLYTVHYTVEEGSLITVAEMILEGASSPDLLLPLWERQQTGTLGLGRPLFVEIGIRSFIDAIITFYRKRGYLEVSVAEPEFVRDQILRTVTVTIRITEGRLFTFGAVTLADPLREALGTDVPALPEGEVITTQRTQELLLAVQARLRRRGYPDPVAQIPPFPPLDSAAIDLRVEGSPGRTATIADVVVTGAEATSESFIREQLSLRTGDSYDGNAVDEAISSLYRTGVLRRVQIRHDWVGDDAVRLTIDVEEAETKFVEFLGGYGSYERLRGGVSFGERNLFGTGKRFLLDGTASLRGYRASATVTDPSLFSSAFTGSVEIETFEREMPSFVDQATGGTVAVSRELAPRLVGRFGYTFLPRRGATTDVGGPAGSALVNYTQGSLFLNFRYDDRDSVLSPTRGWSSFLSLDGFDPALGADVSFLRARVGATHHIQVTGPIRLALRAEAGWIWPGESPDEVPIQERFFNGGENTVRSFRQDQLGPIDANGNPVGGEFVNLLSAEARVPLYRAVEAALFADAGNVGVLVQDYTLRNLSYALGAGLRLALPIGPLRLDAAWNPDRKPGEREWTTHFSIGYPF